MYMTNLEITIKKKLENSAADLTFQDIQDINTCLLIVELIHTITIPLVKEITSILSDGCLDISDIPQIILIITHLYAKLPSNIVLLDLSNKHHLIVLIKFFVDCVIESDLFDVSSTNKELVEKMMNHTLDVLKININDFHTIVEKVDNTLCWNLFCGGLFCSNKKLKEI